MTAIELIANELRRAGVTVAEVLVPEQCAVVYVNDQALHITAQPMPDVCDVTHGCSDVHGPIPL